MRPWHIRGFPLESLLVTPTDSEPFLLRVEVSLRQVPTILLFWLEEEFKVMLTKQRGLVTPRQQIIVKRKGTSLSTELAVRRVAFKPPYSASWQATHAVLQTEGHVREHERKKRGHEMFSSPTVNFHTHCLRWAGRKSKYVTPKYEHFGKKTVLNWKQLRKSSYKKNRKVFCLLTICLEAGLSI